MGIEVLEKKFQSYSLQHPLHLLQLREFARQIARLQQKMRRIFAPIAPSLCSACTTKCCSGMPIEGWFTAEDYFAYRMLYDMPAALKAEAPIWGSCSFLHPDGCSLPEDMRPLACVKVNCPALNRELEERGGIEEFKRLCAALDDIQTKLWELVTAHEEQ
jgi:hypothetical protein